MAEVKLVAEPREGTGKGVARKLRAAGRVPAVLYGHGMDSTALSVDARDLYHVLHTGAGTNVLVGANWPVQVNTVTSAATNFSIPTNFENSMYRHTRSKSQTPSVAFRRWRCLPPRAATRSS